MLTGPASLVGRLLTRGLLVLGLAHPHQQASVHSVSREGAASAVEALPCLEGLQKSHTTLCSWQRGHRSGKACPLRGL